MGAPIRSPCTADQNASLRAYRRSFIEAIAGVTNGKPKNGIYIDSCYVHEQNVNYCSGQGMPNCVGWSPLESGSKKWGYSINVTVPDGRALTPQQAFSAYYSGDRAASIAVDQHQFFDNPSCIYLGKPAPPPSPPEDCADFSGDWIDSPHWFTPVTFIQRGCSGSWPGHTYIVQGNKMVTSKDFHGGLTGTLVKGSSQDTIEWSNGAQWERDRTQVLALV